MRQYFVIFIFLLNLVFLSCTISGCIERNTLPNTLETVPTSYPSQVTTSIIQSSPAPTPSLNKTIITEKKDCTPPRLKYWLHYPEIMVSDTCFGTAAPIFSIPEYPSNKIINDPIVGKFYWWADNEYFEFRNDSVWILYANDNQPHYYPGTWVRLDKDHLITGHEFSYRIEIVRPSGRCCSNYNETINLFYNSQENKLYLHALDEVVYHDINAWTTRIPSSKE